MLITVPTKSLARLRWIQIASIAFCAFTYSKKDTKTSVQYQLQIHLFITKKYYIFFKSHAYKLAKIYPQSLSEHIVIYDIINTF